MAERLGTSTYYVTLPNAGVTAEVTAGSTRQARTVYLDYLTRSGIVPWRGRNTLRDQIIIDRISPGQIPTDVQLSYGQQAPIPEEDLEFPEGYENGSVNGSSNGSSRYFQENGDEDYGVQYQEEEVPQPSYYQQQRFLTQPAYGGAERQAVTDPQFGGRPEYAEAPPTYTGSRLQKFPADTQVQESLRQRIPVAPPSVSPTVTSPRQVPHPAGKPKKLPGLMPGERIPMMPVGSLKDHGPLGETKIAKFVKSRFPKGGI